jgi:isopropylmalate/homocitrate/citramalate synthase
MDEVLICEMSPRDGLQFLGGPSRESPALVPLERKLALIEALRAAGLRFIEVAAFVSAKVTPQMADSDALCTHEALTPREGELLAALVPNAKHYERFRATRLSVAALFVSAGEAYSRKNLGVSIDQSMAWAGQAADAARADGRRLRAHVSAAFQDIERGERDSDLATVVDVSRRLVEMGCEHVALADTNGEAHPRRVRAVCEAVGREIGVGRVGVHLHDRNGWAAASACAALEAGVRIFDSSVGGLGGSATASSLVAGGGRGIAGNIATEMLVAMFERMGLATGVDIEKLLRAGELLRDITRATGDPPPPSKMLADYLGLRSV